MANMNIGTPRFYTDYINYFLSRGVAQNGNFDVSATSSGDKLMGTFLTGSEPELFDMNPLNKVTFHTSLDPDARVLITLDMQGFHEKSFVAILNHNLVSAAGKIRLFGGNAADDTTSIDGTTADTGDMNWSNITVTEIVNADAIAATDISDAAYDDRSVVIEPATNGSTIFKFTAQTFRYWAIQFEGKTSDDSATAVDGTWGGTDLFIGCILFGELYEMPHAPDLSVKRSIIFDKMNVSESIGGQRYSNMSSHGRTATSTSKSPFATGSSNYDTYGGRIAYDLNFSFLNSTDVMPNEYDNIQTGDDAVVEDIWNKTNGPHIPFIFSVDKDSQGDNAESEHIFARFGKDSLDMAQVANDIWNISMRIEEEF